MILNRYNASSPEGRKRMPVVQMVQMVQMVQEWTHRLKRLLHHRMVWMPLLGAGTGLALTLLILLLRTPDYMATMVVGPTARQGLAAMGARQPTLDREAGTPLVEYGLGDETLSDFARYVYLLSAVPITEKLLAQPDFATGLLPRLFPERWDTTHKVWHLPGGIIGWGQRIILGVVGRETWSTPDAQRLSQWLRQRLNTDTIARTPMRRLSLRHPDRALAVMLLSRLHEAADSHLRTEAERRTQTQIAYIRKRATTVTYQDHRQALAGLLAEYERVATMLAIDLPFAADVIEPAYAQSLPEIPDPLLLFPLAMTAGAALGLLLTQTIRNIASSRVASLNTSRDDQNREHVVAHNQATPHAMAKHGAEIA